MLPQEIIRRKRDGGTLAAEEIAFLVEGISAGRISEGQAAAFAMAVYFRGMTRAETVALTLAKAASGTRLRWDDLGPVVDKHSTGGIGDKVSLILAPILAACDAYVPMISGRGLGHTGGTLDKLDSIPGYDTAPGLERLRGRGAHGRLRDHRPDGGAGAGRPAPVRDPRRHGDGRERAADRRLDPVEEARGRARRPGHGRQGRLRRVPALARCRPRSRPQPGRGRERGGPALSRAADGHGPVPRPQRRQRARGARGDRPADRRAQGPAAASR